MATPKFYFFDTGVVNGLTKRVINVLQGDQAGAALEHYILMELIAYRGLNDLDFKISFWRTRTGLEVDFILADAEVAIEVKISDRIKSNNLNGLYSFVEDYQPKRAIVVSNVDKPRIMEHKTKGCKIEIFPWQRFLEDLWSKQII